MGEWRLASLEHLCQRVTSGGTPARSHPEYFAEGGPGHPWVKSSELRDGRIRRTEEKITDLGLENSAAKLLDPETVLVAMYGATAGKVGFLLTEAALNQAVCALVPDADRADSAFLFYALRAKYETLSSSTAGAAQQNLNAGTIKALSIPVPELPTQRRIAAVLSALDDLIELNERRSELLEDLARSLYREWFVHFRFPGRINGEPAESGPGPIPKGWSLSRLADFAEAVVDGVEPPEFEVSDRYIGLEHLSRRSTTLQRWGSTETVRSRKLRFVRGDTLFGKIRPNLHKVAWAPFTGLASSDTVIMRPRNGLTGFVNAVASSDRFVAETVATANGTKMPRADPRAMLAYEVMAPDKASPLLARFSQIVERWLGWSGELVEMNHMLAAIRDLLLPRLVTGQLDISDIDLGVLTPAESD